MATLSLSQHTFQNFFKKSQVTTSFKCIEFNKETGECEKSERQESVIPNKTDWKNVTNYLLHASYEGFKQNLNGADINIDYLLLTLKVYSAIGLKLASKPVKSISHTVNKIISTLNRPHNHSVLN